ncbi:DUF2806 domain-containing protein [Rhodobacteraceae bacterium KMM 6894]|nr:DUF2806 domain-containing protein [Rhodobacteraceae bacterium KMM 6894]
MATNGGSRQASQSVAFDVKRLREALDAERARENGPLFGLSLRDIADHSREAFDQGIALGTINNALQGGKISRKSAAVLAKLARQSVAFLSGESDTPSEDGVPAHRLSNAVQELDDNTIMDLSLRVFDKLFEYGAASDAAGTAGGMEGETATKRRVGRLATDIRAGRVSTDPNKPEELFEGIPKMFWREETRTRRIALNALFFVDADRPLESPSEDWRSLFRANASKASDPKMQTLWSRILGREMSCPGSISFKTLSTVPTLTAAIAADFVRFCGALTEIEGVPVYIRPEDDKGPNHYLAMFGLDYDRVLRLDEFGLVALAHRAFDVEPGCRFQYPEGHYHAREEFRISVNALTMVGRELRPLVKPETSFAYFKATHKSLGRKVKPYQLRKE